MKKLFLLLIIMVMFLNINVYALPVDDSINENIQTEEQLEEEIEDEELEEFANEEKEEVKNSFNIKVDSKNIVIVIIGLCLGVMVIFSMRRNSNE